LSDSIEVSTVLPATPQQVYDAWLGGRRHSKMTGGRATGSKVIGGRFTAWDGYVTGNNLELEPGKRIVQSWRTAEFPDGAPDSRLEIVLAPARGGTRLTLRNTELPHGDGPKYRDGWTEHYFAPMK